MIKRHKYLVNREIQFRYMRLVFIPLALLLAALYWFIYYSVFRQMLIPEAVATTLLPAMRQVNAGLLIAAPIFFIVIFRAALIYSNRLIGPIPRLERELDRIVAGDYSVRLKVRSKDELRGLIGKINKIVEAQAILR